jgi:uncharacterized protein YoxC
MSEITNDFDASQALARVSVLARSAAARAGRKGKKFKPEDQRQVAESLGELLVRSTLPLAEITESVQNVSKPLYAETLGHFWTRLPPERRNDATQWIEGLPKEHGNIIRRFLVPIIAEQDPRTARLILPAKPNALDSAEDRERFAKDWLGRDIGPFGTLLASELAEYEVTRVLRLFLRLANEPVVASSIRSQAIRVAAQALTDHNLSREKGNVEHIVSTLAELIATLPQVEASATIDYLCQRTPTVASRLSLKLPAQNSPAAQNVVSKNEAASSPSLDKQEELSEQQLPIIELRENVAPGQRDQPKSLLLGAEAPSIETRLNLSLRSEGTVDDDKLISSLETRAREHRESAMLLEEAASRLKVAAKHASVLETTLAALQKDCDAQDKLREILENRIESLSRDLAKKEEQLRARTDELRGKDDAVRALEGSTRDLSGQLTEATNSASKAQSRLVAIVATHKGELETLLQRVAGQTDQRLEEFRNDLARRISDILRGTPPLDSGNSLVDGKAILFRLWEIIEALKRKSIPIRNE